MKKTYQKEVVETKTFIDELRCDKCNEQIPDGNNYYSVLTGHHNWGRDSIESHAEYDLCSKKCVAKHMKKYYSEETDLNSFYNVERKLLNSEWAIW